MHIPGSYIKEVAIEIDDKYEFDNSPYATTREGRKNRKPWLNIWPFKKRKRQNENSKKIFLGREKNTAKLKEFFSTEKGVYLVTGYRGMGKTSFVNKSVEDYKKENNDRNKSKKIIDINIVLSQSELNEFNILKLMVSSVFDCYKRHRKTERKERLRKLRSKLAAFLFVGLLLIALRIVFTRESFEEVLSIQTSKKIFPVIAGLCLLYGAYIIIELFVGAFRKDSYARIKKLVSRCYSTIIKEKSSQPEAFIETFNTRISGSQEKETQNFPIASSKEIEYELGQFLIEVSDKISFIFIFDELDKVEPAVVTTSYYQDLESYEKTPDNTYLHQLRNRKQAVLNIISGLKNFLTTAKSNFIFIAGREMFDASLADIADRQSSISSMFNYVFYIDSLLKEKKEHDDSASLSNRIEEYLRIVIFKPDNEHSLDTLIRKEAEQSGLQKEEMYKIIVTIQNFIIYLTYRSNGSPKKLIRSIHEFITIVDADQDPYSSESSSGSVILLGKSKKTKTGRSGKKPGPRVKRYLYFNYRDQYRIGFINYLYRPFLIRYGRSLKEKSDSILVATPYLFDHLLKFHPFAFSMTNLELIPEVLATSKTPSLKEHIRIIIDYLSHSHIRETEIGLFDYKYLGRTLQELSYISKTFEEEGAAFNFTLDESYLVKLHVRNKIKELRSIYSRYIEKSENKSQLFFSIAYLNGMLGDLHFFDEEYDDAIIAYSDAINPINHLDVQRMNMRDFITLIRNKLKLGLCFEKISSYEESLAFYTDAANDAKRFLSYNISKGKYISSLNKDSFNQHDKSPVIFYSSSLSDILQIINQAFLAKLIVQEKMGVEGITSNKLAMSCGGFLALANQIEDRCGKNHLIYVNFYLMIGNIVYFKNDNKINEDIKDPKEKMPPDEYKFFKELIQLKLVNRHWSDKENQMEKRKPTVAVYFYVLAILEVLESKLPAKAKAIRDSISKNHLSNNIVTELVEILSDESVRKEQQFSQHHLKYLAILLSNLGDCLLGIYKGETEKRMDSTEEVFDKDRIKEFRDRKDEEKRKEDEKNFVYYLIKKKGDDFRIVDFYDVFTYPQGSSEEEEGI